MWQTGSVKDQVFDRTDHSTAAQLLEIADSLYMVRRQESEPMRWVRRLRHSDLHVPG